MPFSVTMPVTYFTGVTPNARLSTFTSMDAKRRPWSRETARLCSQVQWVDNLQDVYD
jgi:hypothetical protein